MQLRRPRRSTGSSPGGSSTSSPAAASGRINHAVNNLLAAAINEAVAVDDDADGASPEKASDGDEGDASNNNAEEDFEYHEEEQVSDLLRAIRNEMTVEGIKRNTRAKSTFDTHQNENTRFIVWLFYNHTHVLSADLRRDLQDMIDTIDYDTMLKRKYRGKKTVEERKQHYLFNQLRAKVGEYLGTAGSETNKTTVLFDQFVADHEIYVDYLCKRKKSNGGLMKPSVYKSYRASLSFLFWRYDFQTPAPFNAKLKNCMDGIKRVANMARQCGEGNIEDGKRPLTFELYLQFNQWFLELGTTEGMHALAYSLATFNLACRGDSTLMICLKHLQWKGDATGVPFSHSKEEQLGDDPTKRLPRYCFGNPFLQEADFISGMFLYLATNPSLLDDKDGPLFPIQKSNDSPDKKSHSTKFNNTLKLMLKDPVKRSIIQTKYGFDPDDIGVHSWRKAAHTKMSCGSTAGPTNSAACIRGGHSIVP